MDYAGWAPQGVPRDVCPEPETGYGKLQSWHVGADFGRFGLEFWDKVDQLDARNQERRRQLQELNEWRNAIAHEDTRVLTRQPLHLDDVREWRRLCENLAPCFDEVMRLHLESITGASPW